MPTAAAKDITFIVPGQARVRAAATAPPAGAATAAGHVRGRLKVSVAVGARRGPGDDVRVTARPGDDVVVLGIDNGPTLYLHPDDARDLMQAQIPGATRSSLQSGARGAAPAGGDEGGNGNGDDEVAVSAQLGWPGLEAEATRGATRGWMGRVALRAFEVLTDLPRERMVGLASAAVTRKLDGAVDAGVYELSADALAPLKGSGRKREQLPPAADGGPLLVLVHGTFVDTVSTFGKLWTLHPQTVRQLFGHYAGRIYALDHPTMGESPIGNALTLMRALPAGARLHLVTHSRGGLVAEVLARACGAPPPTGDELALFAEPAYARHLAELAELVGQAKAKAVRVERIVRVACPARGTLLASRRFDAYLSVLKWGLELAALPVAPQLVEFLIEVARRRADPAELPGIEAMMPSSPVVGWLNRGGAGGAAIPGELRVIAGDIEGDSVGSWVKTLLADAFYWTDNDLVVQTRSMYGGTPRGAAEADSAGGGTGGAGGGRASFLLERGAKVSHFNYFANERSVAAIASALIDAAPAGFQAIGPLSWAGQEAGGSRAARAVARSRGATSGEAASRPAVFVLPGILGSNLKQDGERIWLGGRFVDGLQRLAWDRASAGRIEPDGPVDGVYDELIERLADSHEVIVFAFDWRRPIEDEARRLAEAVDLALGVRQASRQPVRILAHSMGGLVARAMQLERPETWQRLMAREGARLLMLGTPNGGSWAPMQTLSGDDTFGNALVAFGGLFDGNAAARRTLAGLPGLIQLQAGLLDPALGLDKAATWQQLADADLARLAERSLWHDEGPQRGVYEWGAPPQPVLDQAVALRKRLDAQAARLGADAKKMLLVVGRARFTPDGFALGEGGLDYLDAADAGDGKVTLANALLPGVATWSVDASHGDLPSVPNAFAGYIELLASGRTGLLEALDAAGAGVRGDSGGAAGSMAQPAASSSSSLRPAAGAGPARVRSRPSRGLLSAQPPSSPADVFGVALARPADAATGRGTARRSALRVSVLNGDLKFVHQPLLIGHYRALALSGTEAVVDRLVGRAMSQSLQAGLYPDGTGTHQIFGNLRPDPDNVLAMARPVAAIVAGLGAEGKLRASELVYTVRQAVLAYAQRVAEQQQHASGSAQQRQGGSAQPFELAATLLGSGGTGVSPGAAAQLIAQGAFEANQKLQDSGWPQIARLVLVEFYLDRASEAWRALQVQATAMPQQIEVVGMVESGAGALRRSLDSSYRGAAYDFISALTGPVDPGSGEPSIAYTLDTRRARTEVRAQQAQGTLLRELVAKASNDAGSDQQIGRTLFKLLVPVEMEPFLGGTMEMLIELDAGTAVIPWELLDTDAAAQQGGGDPRPWAIRSKLLRKLRTEEFRAQVSDTSADDNVLVIGEPLCDRTLYPPLPGARAEGVAVAARLGSGAAGVEASKVRALVSGSDDARTIINALFERPYRVVHVAGHGELGARGGVVLSGNTFLGAHEVQAMRAVPELVFLNCCHLAGRDAATTLAGVGTGKSYDRAAFAANIAQALIEVGVRCVVAAGWAVEDRPAETFAVTFYEVLLRGERFIDAVAAAREAAWRENPKGNTWAAYQCYGDPGWTWSSAGATAQRSSKAPIGDEFAGVSSPVALALALETLAVQSRFGSAKQETQRDKVRFLEARFAPLWGTMGAVAEAFGLACGDAGEIDKAIGWYRTALGAADGSASFRAVEQLANQLARRGGSASDAAAARRDIEEAVGHLGRLVALQSTVERESVLGSAYKRLVMVERQQGRRAEALAALEQMAAHYGAAETLARAADADNLFYPSKNGIGAELCLAFLQGRAPQLAEDRLALVRESLDRAATERPDFWAVVGQIELRLLQALAGGRLGAAAPALIDALRDLKARVPAERMWASVRDEARFVLGPFCETTADAAGRRAADDLLKALEAMAGPA